MGMKTRLSIAESSHAVKVSAHIHNTSKTKTWSSRGKDHVLKDCISWGNMLDIRKDAFRERRYATISSMSVVETGMHLPDLKS